MNNGWVNISKCIIYTRQWQMGTVENRSINSQNLVMVCRQSRFEYLFDYLDANDHCQIVKDIQNIRFTDLRILLLKKNGIESV